MEFDIVNEACQKMQHGLKCSCNTQHFTEGFEPVTFGYWSNDYNHSVWPSYLILTKKK